MNRCVSLICICICIIYSLLKIIREGREKKEDRERTGRGAGARRRLWKGEGPGLRSRRLWKGAGDRG